MRKRIRPEARRRDRDRLLGRVGLFRLVLLVLLPLSIGACASFPDPIEGEVWPTPARGVVVSEHPLASSVGRDVLERGGNAVDAAVATAFALAVVHPQAGNLGGGGFAIHVPHRKDAAILALDFRETAPALLTPEAFLDENGEVVRERALASHLAVGVPGSPYGLWELHRRGGGVLSWQEVLTPAIDLASEGFRVDPWLARALADEGIRKRVDLGPARVLFYPGGEPLQAGDLLVQRELARTLAILAAEGPAGFYGGPVGDALIAEMRRGGGVMRAADLAAYRPIEREPLRGWFRGQELITMPPPSSGGIVLLQVLSVLDGFPLDQERRATIEASAELAAGDPDAVVDEVGISGRAVHWWIEAMRRAFADRAEHMGDPDFHPV
ncbi:MAG: gamma-glutamyltransferase, partial [Planctomycetota bacterium]|nr:gamma-glutamyltransferase [Planctomycetota bacterium]